MRRPLYGHEMMRRGAVLVTVASLAGVVLGALYLPPGGRMLGATVGLIGVAVGWVAWRMATLMRSELEAAQAAS